MYNYEVATMQSGSKTITIKTLALPMIVKSFLSCFINTLGVLVLSGYSESIVSATSIANQIMVLPQTILNTVATGTVILASIAFGQNAKSKAAEICGSGIVLALFLSVVTGFGIGAFSDGLTRAMNLTGSTQEMSATYLRVTAISLPLQVMFEMFQQLLICNGFSGVLVISGTVTGVLNAGLSYVVLYSAWLPCDVITALGIKTCFAWLVGLLITIAFFIKYRCPVRLSCRIRHMLKVLKLGLPAGMCLISFNFANTVTTGFLAGFGETVLNTKVYINNIVTYVPLIGYAISSATSVLMGRHRGAGNFDGMKILFRQNLKLVLLINAALSVLVFIFHRPLLALFTKDAGVFSIATLVMLIDIPLELARGINNISESSLNPNGDVRTTLLASVFSAWAFSVLLGYVLSVCLQMELVGLWIAFFVNEAFKATVYLIRWRSGKWQTIQI